MGNSGAKLHEIFEISSVRDKNQDHIIFVRAYRTVLEAQLLPLFFFFKLYNLIPVNFMNKTLWS